jgi:hypothetical protein
MRNIKLLALTFITALSTSIWAQTGQYSTRTISTDGKTSTWAFNVVSGSAKTIPDGTDDNGVIYVNGGGSNKAQTSAYMSFNKSEVYLEVPSGSAGSISMEVSSSSDSRWFQLYINTTEGPATQRLWSKAGDGTDGKKGPQSFTFASTDITTKNAKTYLYLKTNGTEMKVKSFTITLTSGSYSGGPAPASTDATLSSIVYGTEQTPVPNFSADQLSYEVELPADYVGGAPSVQVTTSDANATTNITQATTLPGVATIVVTADDGTTTKTYTVTFTKESADPKVESATWPNIRGTAVIDQVNKTITGQVLNGSSLSLEPTFTGKYLNTQSPTGVQNFANGAISYTFTSASNAQTVYSVTITESPAVSTDATLSSLTYGGKSVPNFSPSTLTYNIELTAGTKTPPTIAATPTDNKATMTITQASSVPGVGKVEVTAEDGTTKLTYTINYTVQVPPSGLTTHVPEIYEAKDIAGGYNTPLVVVGGREYEVFYINRDNSSNLTIATSNVDKAGNICDDSGTSNSAKTKDGWLTISCNGTGGDSNAGTKDEFQSSIRSAKFNSSSHVMEMHIQGYDQFSFYGNDNNQNPAKGKMFELYIDGVKQTRTPQAYAINRFDISTGEHVIKLTAIGGSDSKLCSFSLRVAQEPRTKWLKGNDSTQRVLQTQAIQPITYVTKYNNIPGAETRLEWIGNEATGIRLQEVEGDLTDTLLVSGVANCPTGTYNYAVVAYYNGVETSRATGSFRIATDIQAMTELTVDVYQNEEMDQIKFRYYALDESVVQLTWPNGQPAGIAGSGAANNTYIIGGTPTAAEGVYKFEITALGADTTFKGSIHVKKLDYGQNPVLYLYKNTGADEKDGVYTHLKSKSWNVISRKAKEDGLRPADQYSKYKWILISEDADSDNEEVLAVVRGGASLPVLNMNAFSYAYERNEDTPNGWGEPDNGSISEGGRYITVQRDDHPIFKTLNKKKGDRIQVLDTVTFRGLMPINIKQQGTLCLATSPTRNIEDYEADGEMQTIIHEIPAGMRGGAKYIGFPMSKHSTANLTSDGKKTLDAIVSYLLSPEPTVFVPTVQITGFSLNGIAGKIDQSNNTIHVSINRNEYPDIDLVNAQPVVTLADPQTTVTPASGDTVDLSTSNILPVKYVVTDFINRRVYNVSVTFYSPEGIEEVYTAGDWINIYDIFGRKIATTNEDVYTMSLPRGVYIIVNENGNTFKITR